MKRELRKLKLEQGFISKKNFAFDENEKFSGLVKEGKELPNNVFEYVDSEGKGTGEFYEIFETDLSAEEREEYIRLKQCKNINTIKNCTIFFTTLAVVGLALAIINYISLMM